MEENFQLFFKMSKNVYRETATQKIFDKKEDKFKSMSVHTFNALQELKKQDLLDEAKEMETIEELIEFYKSKIKDNKNRLHKEIEFVRLYQEVRKS
jgi:TPP-dependent trihydroxycyclohexane-1,2-dione (THcHDO) dehydratase